MNETRTRWLLWITGAATAAAGATFFAPRTLLALLNVQVSGSGGLFYAQHWAAMVACFGVLLVLAATRPALRVPVMTAALVEKLALVGMVAASWQDPALAGLHLAAVFDGVCVVLYAVWLRGPRSGG